MTQRTSDGRRDVFLGVRMTQAERDLLAAVAQERSTSVGSVLRWAVGVALADDGRKATPPANDTGGACAF